LENQRLATGSKYSISPAAAHRRPRGLPLAPACGHAPGAGEWTAADRAASSASETRNPERGTVVTAKRRAGSSAAARRADDDDFGRRWSDWEMARGACRAAAEVV
jgi:hypothetical protein